MELVEDHYDNHVIHQGTQDQPRQNSQKENRVANMSFKVTSGHHR